jgi:prevent-host-death family protein
MKRVPIAEFKAHCSQYIENLADEEIVITKHGKPVARLVAEASRKSPWDFDGILKGQVYVDPDDDLLSTGARWDAES